WTRANPYSLSAAPDGRSLRITIQDVGDGSRATRSLRPGTRALIEGPYGRLSPRAASRRRIALIGAGVGVTPLRALAEGMHYAPGDAAVLHRYASQPLFAREFDVIARERGLQMLNVAGHRRSADSWLGAAAGPIDRVSDVAALTYWIPDIADRDVYVCGPEHWTDLVRDTLTACGLPPDQLHLETFKW
ncbi:MAG TPA: oxidoreductase, partial [Nocardioidaceae bacterium]|nr:oxidoreductase [Nocardioidaceae bacterium]